MLLLIDMYLSWSSGLCHDEQDALYAIHVEPWCASILPTNHEEFPGLFSDGDEDTKFALPQYYGTMLNNLLREVDSLRESQIKGSE